MTNIIAPPHAPGYDVHEGGTNMAVRKIVEIDQALCNGCGLCATACAEGAIQLIDGKARLVKDDYCDGLGACLGECPRGAITIVERAAAAQLGSAAILAANEGGAPSALRQWPVQLHLLSPTAPYLRDAELLLAADCAAFACGDFHARFLAGRALAIACPKLDDPGGYVEKLAAMITDGGVRGIAIVMMQVPCCRGLERMAELAMQLAETRLPLRRVILGIEGGVLADEMVQLGA